MAVIDPSTLGFLRRLSRNNNRDWFALHKDEYLDAQRNVEEFIDALISEMNVHDRIETPLGKKALYRIYSDVRFSEDKTPYNPRFAGYLRRAKPALRGGYYFWITPGNSRIGCGFVYPNPADLKRIRMDIHYNHDEWRKLLRSKSLAKSFGAMKGDLVKTAPQGFSKNHSAIDLLRYKQYWFEHSFTDKEVLGKHFLKDMNTTFKTIRPFFDHMSEVLGTDMNGEPIV